MKKTEIAMYIIGATGVVTGAISHNWPGAIWAACATIWAHNSFRMEKRLEVVKKTYQEYLDRR
jgi:hypothetical protein